MQVVFTREMGKEKGFLLVLFANVQSPLQTI